MHPSFIIKYNKLSSSGNKDMDRGPIFLDIRGLTCNSFTGCQRLEESSLWGSTGSTQAGCFSANLPNLKCLFGLKSFSFCPFRCVSPMLLAPEAWGQVCRAQPHMGRPVTQHALLLLQCMLVLRPGSMASRRGPVLLPESPCHKTEHPLIPHSGRSSKTCTRNRITIDRFLQSNLNHLIFSINMSSSSFTLNKFRFVNHIGMYTMYDVYVDYVCRLFHQDILLLIGNIKT